MSEKMQEVRVLPNGCGLYRKENEVGGHTYYCDDVGGGVMVWDTCLVAESTLLMAIVDQYKLKFEEQLDGDLLKACEELIDADHYDHFAARLSDSEMAALEKIQRIVAAAKSARLVPSHGNPLGDASDKELADLEARTKARTDFNGGG